MRTECIKIIHMMCEKMATVNLSMRVITFLACCSMALPVISQQKKSNVTPRRKSTLSQPKRTTFDFQLLHNATFQKEGQNNFYVVSFPKKNAHQLYMDVLSHIMSIYKKPDLVTSTVKDRSIIINGYAGDIASFKYYDEYYSTCLEYNLNFQFKDGKIRVNAPVVIEIYAEGSSQIKKLSDAVNTSSGFNYLFSTGVQDRMNEIDKYINTLISTIIYGPKDEEW